MISTMPKSGEAPSSPNAMPGGLGAILQQPGGAPKGASSRSIQSMIDLAQGMSDAQLADVLAGRSLDVPQYVAMTEAMGRKSLRTAVQGAQAQQSLQQPSVKDKLMAEEAAQQVAGLDQLAAPNMDSVGMAGGGIVAFEDGGLTREKVQEAYDAWQESKGPWYLPTPKGGNAAEKEQEYKDLLRQYQMIQGTQAQMMAPKTTPAVPPASATSVDTGSKPDSLGRHVANMEPTTGTTPAVPKKTGIAALTGGDETPQAKDSQDFLAALAGIPNKQREGLAGIKNQIQSEAALNMAAALFGSPNMSMAMSKGLPLVASTLASGRKEQRELEKSANEFDLNLAKAREAAEAGDLDRAAVYKKMALENQYHMGLLGVQSQRNTLLGESNLMPKVSMALQNADKQALAEAKQKFPILTKSNQAAFDNFVRQRAMELKSQNPLTKDYASLGASDLGGSPFKVVNSPGKGAKIIDLAD